MIFPLKKFLCRSLSSARMRKNLLLLIAATSAGLLSTSTNLRGQTASEAGKSDKPSADNQEKKKKTDKLPDLVVTGKRDPGYAKPVVQSSTKTDTPIAKSPVSAQVVPKEVIQDQGVTKLEDAYRNVSGVAPVNTAGSGIQFENVNIRGFSQRASVDGVNFYAIPKLDVAGIEQIEILKGPASSMYGMLEPGGMVNVVPKTAGFYNHGEITGLIGSYDIYGGTIDFNHELDPNHLAFRFVGSLTENDSFRDYSHRESRFLSPSILWLPTPDTRISSWLWYENLDRPVDCGVSFTYNGHPAGDIDVNRTDPNHNTQPIEDVVWGLKVEHDTAPNVTVRDRFLLHYFDSSMDAVRVNGATTNKNTYTTYLDNSSFWLLEYNNQLEVLYRKDIGKTSHKILGGLETSRSEYTYDRLISQNSNPISIFHPVPSTGPYIMTPGAAEQLTLTTGAAAYLQDEMDALDEKLHVLAGGRFDLVDQTYRPWNAAHKEYTSEDTGFSGRIGALYDVTPWMSPFANICQSFNPNAPNTTTYDGNTLDPTTGIQYEGGLKFPLFDKSLLLTTSLFDITKDNVAVNDPNHTGFSLNGGKLRSKGAEIDAVGNITESWQIIGNYTHCDTEVLKSSSLPVGARFVGIPDNSGSLWVKYTFHDGPLEGFGIGTGVFLSGSKAGDNNNTFNLPGYARWDAGLFYTHQVAPGHELKIALNILNLLDRTYYEASSSTGSVMPGAPTTAMLRVGYTL